MAARRALGLGLFVCGALAEYLGGAWLYLSFYSDGCGGQPRPEFVQLGVIALGVAVILTIGGLRTLAGPSRWLLGLASLAVTLVIGWNLLLYILEDLATATGCGGRPWLTAAGPAGLLILGILATAVLPTLPRDGLQ